jgi:hypothetical protein
LEVKYGELINSIKLSSFPAFWLLFFSPSPLPTLIPSSLHTFPPSHLLNFKASHLLAFSPSNRFPDFIKAGQRLIGERVVEHFEEQRLRY